MGSGVRWDAMCTVDGTIALGRSWQPTQETFSPGIAVYQEMKQDPELQAVPIFIITGASEATGVDMLTGEPLPAEDYADDFTRRFGDRIHGQLQSMAPDVFIEKPIDHEDVARRIKEVLA